MREKRWRMTIYLFDSDVSSHAEAVLRAEDGRELRSTGSVRRRPGKRHDARIGDELAACQALAGLGDDLLDAAVGKVLAAAPAACAGDRAVLGIE